MFDTSSPPIPPLQSESGGLIIPDRTRVLLLVVRKALIEILGALEDYLGMEHSVMGARERRRMERTGG